jgi:hypothetical protein
MLIYLEAMIKIKEAGMEAKYATIKNYFNVGGIYFFKIKKKCGHVYSAHSGK